MILEFLSKKEFFDKVNGDTDINIIENYYLPKTFSDNDIINLIRKNEANGYFTCVGPTTIFYIYYSELPDLDKTDEHHFNLVLAARSKFATIDTKFSYIFI